MLPTITWKNNTVVMIDQRKLPAREAYIVCRTVEAVARAIESLAIRGAPAIGVAAAYGVALGMQGLRKSDASRMDVLFERIFRRIERTRPTARNLFWALERMRRTYDGAKSSGPAAVSRALLAEAKAMDAEDAEINRRIGLHGRVVVEDGMNILTHCNAGALATSDYGTALGVVRAAVEEGKSVRVFADETRPVLQGARLTCWELLRDRIPVVLITDNMAGWLMKNGEIHLVVVGADRIAANGDTANKIGTYSAAVLARENGVPFYVAAPFSTVDLSLRTGRDIPIEERDGDEVRRWGGRLTTIAGIPVRNPAFDVTPARYIAGIITENGIARPPFGKSLRRLSGTGS